MERPDGEGELYSVILNPPKSPDCAKVIEHPIHAIKSHFRKEFTQMVGKVSAVAAMELLEGCIEACVDVGSIRDDIRTLPATLKQIFARQGDWADTLLR